MLFRSEDWVRQRAKPATAVAPTAGTTIQQRRDAPTKAAKLSYKEQRELDALPALIESLEHEERELQARIASPEVYKERREDIDAALARQQALAVELATAYERWSALESRVS